MVPFHARYVMVYKKIEKKLHIDNKIACILCLTLV